MNELIPITYQNDRPAVSARELHDFLEVKTDFPHWFSRMCEYGFSENVDFAKLPGQKCPTNNPKNPWTEITDYSLSIDMAKELCMIQRTERGKQARQYFLQIEKNWNSPEKVMARALQIANDTIKSLSFENTQQKQLIAEYEPKANYVDEILSSRDAVNITQISKDYGMSGESMNKLLHDKGVQYKLGDQWLLYSKYQHEGYTKSTTKQITHRDGTPGSVLHTKWTQKGRLFIYELLKASGIYPLIEQDDPKTA